MEDFSNSDDSSDAESVNSDEELQRAFAKGELKDGLNIGLDVPEKFQNDEDGMKKKLEELQQSLDWIERLDMTNDPAPAPPGTEESADSPDVDLVNDDFKREMKFYRQGQASVLLCLEKLHKKGIKTKRPDDYFAEMAKSDIHMKKVREKLLEKQKTIEMKEKARKLRELKKYGKKVQHEVLLKRQKEKREMLDAVKKFRKDMKSKIQPELPSRFKGVNPIGQKDQLDFLNEDGESQGSGGGENKKQKDENQSQRPGKKRQFKNNKFGFGGQKKRSKSNTKESTNELDMFKKKGFKGKPGFDKKKQKKVKRPGKSKRVAMKGRRNR